MLRPQRALISREADDNHEELHDIPGLVATDPVVGETLALWLDTGKLVRTTAVKRVARRGEELVVDTANSRYRLRLQAA